MKPYYQDSACTIYHGDAREWMASVPSCFAVDMVLTDPPYNVGLGSKPHAQRQNGYVSHNDNMHPNEYMKLISSVSEWSAQHAALTIVTPGNSNQTVWPKPTWTLAWVKMNGVTRTPLTRGQKMNHACWEPILVYGKLDDPPHADVINLPISIQPECNEHPCPKPLMLFTRLLSFTNASAVIDPFMGSGTTLRAAKDLGRKAIGIEIEERYCEIAAKRLAQEVLPL